MIHKVVVAVADHTLSVVSVVRVSALFAALLGELALVSVVHESALFAALLGAEASHWAGRAEHVPVERCLEYSRARRHCLGDVGDTSQSAVSLVAAEPHYDTAELQLSGLRL